MTSYNCTLENLGSLERTISSFASVHSTSYRSGIIQFLCTINKSPTPEIEEGSKVLIVSDDSSDYLKEFTITIKNFVQDTKKSIKFSSDTKIGENFRIKFIRGKI